MIKEMISRIKTRLKGMKTQNRYDGFMAALYFLNPEYRTSTNEQRITSPWASSESWFFQQNLLHPRVRVN
jgi:hypothetical protein